MVSLPSVVATTGTNGKTSTTTFVRQLCEAAGIRATSYTSHGVVDPTGMHRPITRGTVDTLLPQLLAQAQEGRVAVVALEAFAAALAVGAYRPIDVDVAVVTGITADHLDVHGTFERYADAKLRLVREAVCDDGVIVVPVGAPLVDRVLAVAAARGLACRAVGIGGDVELLDRRRIDRAGDGVVGSGMTGTLRVDGLKIEGVELGIGDDLFVDNLLLAATALIATGVPVDTVASALPSARLPPGRLEYVGELDEVAIVVDAAHNADALRSALQSVRARTTGRLIVVFGCGGNRDRGKRAVMGAVAATHADVVIVTDDNPRRESAAAIRRSIRAGCPDAVEIPDRSDAVEAAMALARPGDSVLIAGRGDEQVQIVGSHALSHDDRAVARRLLQDARHRRR